MRSWFAGGAVLLGILLAGAVWLGLVVLKRALSLEPRTDLASQSVRTHPQQGEDEQVQVGSGQRDVRAGRVDLATAPGPFAEIEQRIAELAPPDSDQTEPGRVAVVAVAETIEQRKSLESMPPQTLARFMRASAWSGADLSMVVELLDRERTQRDLVATYGKRADEGSDAKTASFWRQQQSRRTIEVEKAKLLLGFIVSALRDGDAGLARVLCGVDVVRLPSVERVQEQVVREIRTYMQEKLDARMAEFDAKSKPDLTPSSER